MGPEHAPSSAAVTPAAMTALITSRLRDESSTWARPSHETNARAWRWVDQRLA